MNNEIQFKIVRGKGNYGGDNTVKQISEILSLNKNSSQCSQLRILHCQQFAVLNGIEICKQLKNLNISCNAIEDLTPLRHLIALESLDVKANRIRSLKGIQNLRRLIKIDASQNRIETLEGLSQMNCQIQTIILYKNNLKDLQEMSRLSNFKEIKQLCFERGSSDRSNPFCQNKSEYYAALQANLQASKDAVKKLDDLSPEQISKLFQFKIQQESKNQNSISHNNTENYHRYNQSSEFEQIRNQNLYTQTASMNALTNQKLMLMTQRQVDLERIINLKEETIEQMRRKQAELELTNTNQFRESIKKQAEFERVTGQVTQLSKHIDQKDYKINELHKRIEELLKVNAAANAIADKRSQQLEALRREFGELRIQNSELRVLNKDQENRLRELQNKALSNIEDKSQRLEELRSKNEQIMRENYQLQHQQEQYKDRVRELTQLLKEWQTKYQQTVRQLEAFHNHEKEQIFTEFDTKTHELTRKFDDTKRALNHEWEEKINALQNEYSGALEGALQKYSRLKRAYDDKANTEGEIKAMLKSIMAKNTQNQNTIKEYEQAIIKTKKAIISLTSQHESLTKEHYQVKSKLEGEVRLLQTELSKVQFSRDKYERDARELRATNEYLQKNYDNLSSHEKQFQELLQKCEGLQFALDSKNVMLDDKNETIEALKLEIQQKTNQLEGKIDQNEFDKIKKKYNREKEMVNELSKNLQELNDQIAPLRQKQQSWNQFEQQFTEIKEIIKKQETEIKEKDQMNNQLINSLEKLKRYSENINEQLNIAKNQKNKLLHTIEDKENKWNRLMREKEMQYERKMNSLQEETNKFKQIAQQFKNFTKTLNF